MSESDWEWDVETGIYDNGEWLCEEHNFQSSYHDCVKEKMDLEEEGMASKIVLVCTRWKRRSQPRSWAYVEDGKLPEYTSDAYGHDAEKVLKRFHKEVDSYNENC